MSNPGILFSLVAAMGFSAANIVDAQLSRAEFKSIGTLLFYSCVFNLVVTLPVLLHPAFALPDNALDWALLTASSIAHLLSYWLLYNALKRYETAIVTCVTTLTLSLVPVVSALTGYEPLVPVQWLGFALCVGSAIGLTWQKKRSKAQRSGLWFAFGCGLTFCAAALLDDRLSQKIHWSAQYAGIQAIMMLAMAVWLVKSKFRRRIRAGWPVFKENKMGFFLSEIAFGLGTILAILAYQATQVSVVEAVIATMPAMIFAASFILPKRLVHDDLQQGRARKLGCFALTVLGVYLLH